MTIAHTSHAQAQNGQGARARIHLPVTLARAEPAPDAELQEARRVDWRFLLPEPILDRVAYLGPGRGNLLPALTQFSRSLAINPSPADVADASELIFDLVVCQGPDRKTLTRAAQLLRPGGYLYMEGFNRAGRSAANRPLWPGRLKRPAGLRESQAALRRLGFQGIQAFWHRPDFEACLEIIPLDSPSVPTYAFERHGRVGSLSGQVLKLAGWCLSASGLLGRTVPCFSLVAHKPPAAFESDSHTPAENERS